MSTKHNREILIIVIAILVVGAFTPIVTHFELQSETDAYISRLKARGEPMELVQVLPPPVPAEQNSADALAEAFALIDADDGLLATNFYGIEMMKMVAPGKAIVCWREPEDEGPPATNSWQDLTAAVAQNQMTFALLRQTIDKPDADFAIQYDRGMADLGVKNLYLPESKRAAQRLSAAVMCDLHNGDTASAIENLRAMLALARAMGDQRLIISELVRMAILQISVAANWEVLQSSNLTNADLAQLQSDWAKFNFIKSSENAMAMERVIGEITIKKWRVSGSRLSGALGGGGNLWDSVKITSKMAMWRGWWSYPDELRALQGYDAMITGMRLEQTNNSFLEAIRYQDKRLDALNLTNSDYTLAASDLDYHWLFSEDIGDLAVTMRRVMTVDTARQIVITAIALKRWHLKHGDYPATLDALVPKYLPAVPLDPVDGKPLRYRRKADGTFLLYSVGPNGVDDGGNPALEKGAKSANMFWLDYNALDWVWPSPVIGAGTNADSNP
ncbi:MAG TPA: hypothetical protein VME24_11715 [Alphaproteobacteria bacterium]|nr:hypothetical protein [Alphaproteobacteria bacterium]